MGVSATSPQVGQLALMVVIVGSSQVDRCAGPVPPMIGPDDLKVEDRIAIRPPGPRRGGPLGLGRVVREERSGVVLDLSAQNLGREDPRVPPEADH